MDIFEFNKLVLFLIVFIPGFISLKIYDLKIPSAQRDFSKSVLEVIGYSALNFAALSWLIIIIHQNDFHVKHELLYYIFLIVIMLIMPILWPLIILWLYSFPSISKHLIHHMPTPWDYVFNKRELYWIIVHLKDDRRIGGLYGLDSYVTSYPEKQQIYLEDVWLLDKDNRFIKPIPNSRGIILSNDVILGVELFEYSK